MTQRVDYKKIREIVAEEAATASANIPTTIIAKVAKEASKEAVIEILTTCGIDVTDPFEMQNLMAYARQCKKNSKRTKRVIAWGEETMESGKIFKKNFIAEAGKHACTAIVAIFVVWVASTKDFLGGG